jgi:uncharacterized protein YjdB
MNTRPHIVMYPHVIGRTSLRLLVLLGVTLGACQPSEQIAVATPTAVSIASASTTVSVGGTVTLTANASSNGVALQGVTPAWTTSDATIANVSSSGVVTGVSRGSATISATVGTARGSTNMTVIGLKSITLAPTAVTLTPGQSVSLTATVDADAGVQAPVSWSTSNAAIATVSNAGAVTAVGAGSAVITATALGRSVTANVTVVIPTVATVNLSPSTASLIVGQTQQFTTTPRDSAGNILTGRTTVWSSSNATVASVSNTGVLTALAPGTMTVQAAIDGRTATAAVTVTPSPVASLTLSQSSVALLVGRSVALTATARDRNGATLNGRPITWRSSNSTVATVDAAGLVTAVATGATVITAECEGSTATAAITVTQTQVATIEGYFGPTIWAGDTASLYFVPKNAAGQVVSGEAFAIDIDGSEVQAGQTVCTAEGCLQRITSTAFANMVNTNMVNRSVTIRPSAVPAGGIPSTKIDVLLIGTRGDSISVNAPGTRVPTTLSVNTRYSFYPFLWFGSGYVQLRNAEFSILSGAATMRRCLQGSSTQNYQSHCMLITPTTTGALSIQVRQRKADGTFWTLVWTGQVIP